MTEATDPAAQSGQPQAQHPDVQRALAELDRVAELPPGEQLAAYEAAHTALTRTLSTIDDS